MGRHRASRQDRPSRQGRLAVPGALVVVGVAVVGMRMVSLAEVSHAEPSGSTAPGSAAADRAAADRAAGAEGATARPIRATLRTGATGAAVTGLQQRLRGLGYQARVAGGYDEETRHAVIAFQKIHGLPRTGQADERTQAALDAPQTPAARKRGPGFHVEVDLTRQVVLFVTVGKVTAIFDACTGGPDSPTPTGSYRIERKIDGVRHAPLGDLWRPSYFVGGYAFHGGEPVLTTPDSHGCVRMTDPSIDATFSRLEVGTRVHIYA